MTRGSDIEFKRDAAPGNRGRLPWRKVEGSSDWFAVIDASAKHVCDYMEDATAAYIVTACNERPAMLSEIDRLTAELALLKAGREKLDDHRELLVSRLDTAARRRGRDKFKAMQMLKDELRGVEIARAILRGGTTP